ncbi:MAG TPA: zf-HC2 domain-containing protein [Pseudonocardiaceae bacterium]
MDCTNWREALSARLDGEESVAERAAIDAHLDSCAGCRQFADHAARVTRLARTTVAADAPDVVDAVLAVAPRSNRPHRVTALRVLLGMVGLAQLAVSSGWMLAMHTGPAANADVRMEGASLQHFAHESAAWNLALGVGFCWVAWRSSRTSGVVPTLTTFVVVLTALVMFDVVNGSVDSSRLLMHGLVMAGLVLVIVLDRWRPPAGGTVPGGTSWLRHRPGRAPKADPAAGPVTGDFPGLRPTAQHSGAAVAAQHEHTAVARRRTA